MKRTLIVSLLIAICLAAPGLGFLGIGDIVFDPSNFDQAVRQLVQLQREYDQLVETYRMVRSQYEHMIRMAERVPVNMVQRYRAAFTPWRTSRATDTYGGTSGWIAGINTGLGVPSGYAQATQKLAEYGAALSSIPSGQLDRVKTAYATVELTDGANLYGIETVGGLRANAPAVEGAIQGLEDDSLSSDPAMNTEIAVLNKINAANMIAVRGVQDSNKLLVALTEQQIIDAKGRRDAEAQALNNHIRFMTEGKAAMDAQAAGASSAMLAWRMP